MKVIEKITYDEDLYIDGQYDVQVLGKNGEVLCNWSIGAGEPEDINLGRDLSDAFNVTKLMILAYEAGRRGESFEVIAHPDSVDY